jgi:formate C-acetyltransferase
MNARIQNLRENSNSSPVRISHERAQLVTEFYRHHALESDPVAVCRAKAFSYILKNKTIPVIEDELIVGERGPEARAVSTYPEITLHSLDDLDILNRREKVPYLVSHETRRCYEIEIIPYWKDRTQRDRIMQSMSTEWHDAYEAGIFTEFQEQRAPGHTVAGHKIYNYGLTELPGLELDSDTENDQGELCAMRISAKAMIHYAERYSQKLKEMARNETRGWRKAELLEMAAICQKVPAHAPETFHEALQYYWFIHLGVITESNPWDSFNPGRLDQHLYPFYHRDIEKGRLTRERAKELLQSFWIKFNNHPAPPKVGVTAKESNTYTDFALINTGGVDAQGNDAVNELSYLILEVVEEMRILQPSSMVQLSHKNPDLFLRKALDIIKTGFGQPSIFNTDLIIEELVRQGKSLTDARLGGASGCVESGAFGKEAYILTGYFNLVKVLEITLNNGKDPATEKQIAPSHNIELNSFEKLLKAYRFNLEFFLEIKMKGNRQIEKIISDHLPVPFLSLFIDDCITKELDYNSGGARYNTSYIQGVGLGSISDSLTALKYHVYDKKTITLETFRKILREDFRGHEEFRHVLLYETPKYGNDDDYADLQAISVFRMFFDIVDGRPAWRPGSKFRINMLPTTSHVYFGEVCQATPDGRKAFKPLSEGISPVQGKDRKGPTAVLKSASKIDHQLTGGTLLNMKLNPSFFNSDNSWSNLIALIRTYFRLKGHHIQFNVVDAEKLKQAQLYPEDFGNLIVRVAGYSDYFNDLSKELQEEIIRRTAHE